MCIRDRLYTYEQYFAAKNGSDLTLTLDTTIQYYLEDVYKRQNHSRERGGYGAAGDARALCPVSGVQIRQDQADGVSSLSLIHI